MSGNRDSLIEGAGLVRVRSDTRHLIVEVTSKLDALAWARVGDVDAVQLPVCRGAEIPEKMSVKIVRWLSGQCAYTFPASRFWRSRRYMVTLSVTGN